MLQRCLAVLLSLLHLLILVNHSHAAPPLRADAESRGKRADFGSGSDSASRRLLLVSIDGFRYDLLNASLVPTIYEWSKTGTWFKNGVKSQQFTYTAPNHMSIVTGLHEENHGITGNFFYDTKEKAFFDIYNASRIPGYAELARKSFWYVNSGEPIWTTVWKAGGRSSVFYWPVGDEAIGKEEGVLFKRFDDEFGEKFGDLPSWESEVDEMIERMATNDVEGSSKNFYAWYLGEPDHTLHGFGFFYEYRFLKKMMEIDAAFHYLLYRLQQADLLSSTDIILTTDHGHSEIRKENVLCVEKYITGWLGFDYSVGNHQIFPKTKEQAMEMYANLTRAVQENNLPVKVHWKEEVEAAWFLRHPSRVGAILLEPAPGADATFRCADYNFSNFHYSTHGQHRDEAEMRGILVLSGPSFASGLVLDSIPENIDLYPLMAQVLGVPPAPNNGTLSRVAAALFSESAVGKEQSSLGMLQSPLFYLLLLPSLLIIAGLVFCIWRRLYPTKDNDTRGVHSPLSSG